MNPIAVGLFSGVAGLVVGTLYGRKAEQKAVGSALADFAKVDAAAHDAVSRLHVRLTFLKKYVWAKV